MKIFIISCLLFLSSLSANAKLIDRILAVVNDEIITKSDVEKYKQELKGNSMQDELFKIDKKALLKSNKKVISQIVDEKIVDSEVKRKGLETTIEQVDEEVRKIQRRNNISRQQLKAALKQQRTSFSAYQNFIKKRLERQSLIQQNITSKIKISDDDVMSYYLANSSRNDAEIFEYTISHIMFLKNSSGGINAAKDRAQKVYKELDSGKSFEVLASQYSEDPNLSPGGLLGSFKAGEMNIEFEKAVKNLSPGSFSTVTTTRFGVHIFKLNKKRLISNPEFEQKKEQIRSFLMQKAFEKQFRFWLDQKRREAFIHFNQA